ncbi:hypothetical protein K461DRAFT_171613 [Myriangium duriaei CBS 260.36]|uniref:C3H1-type domain-containing protein n=1 Tax=Myriangium duriaei CBS 260.36 TaxID=1168546 RepID=A0A9P4IWR6_9PEZI|nr:hypothetical protein K461DRAFT_171613 [Myriangium duriaei CBS 260.36]
MSEDAALQAKIAELSGRISRQKQTTAPDAYRPQPKPPARWSPYGQAFSPRGGYNKGFRNRTLVNASTPKDGSRAATPTESTTPNSGVTTHDRGRMQWTNASVFDKKAQEKIQAIEETANAKRQAKDDAQKNRVVDHVYGQSSRTSTPSQASTPREIIVNDLRFRVATDGSKLIRVFGKDSNYDRYSERSLSVPDGPNAEPHTTPKETKVAGVTFVRTKNGNMVRQGLVKNKRCSKWNLYHGERVSLSLLHRATSGTARKKLCPDFTSTGSCIRGNRCHFQHDVDKLAICKEFLRHGECAAGEDCNLSHEPTPHRVPTCLHFLRNNCTKPDCRYSHVQVDPSAPVCKDFARLGFCEKGAACVDRHVSECPDYTNTGVCRNSKCRLPHIDRAGTLRKAAAQKAAKGSDDDVSFDVSSDEGNYDEIDSDDADSDEMGEEDVVMAGSSDAGGELSQQQDFIAFS